MRVQNVRDLTTWLLRDTPGWIAPADRGSDPTGVNTPIKLAVEVPVYFIYISAWGVPDGIVQFRDDIYQMDGEQELALRDHGGHGAGRSSRAGPAARNKAIRAFCAQGRVFLEDARPFACRRCPARQVERNRANRTARIALAMARTLNIVPQSSQEL